MKTGRLLKFHRPGGEVHAYLYREGAGFRAAVYLMSPDRGRENEAGHGATSGDVGLSSIVNSQWSIVNSQSVQLRLPNVPEGPQSQ